MCNVSNKNTDADDKDDDEDDGKEEKKSDGRWHMKKEDDAMDIFMHLYKKLHDRREKIVCKWREELEWGTWNCLISNLSLCLKIAWFQTR